MLADRPAPTRAHRGPGPRSLALALAATALLAAGCGEKDEPQLAATTTAPPTGATAEIAGDWTGTLSQKGLKPFRVAVRIEPAGTARVAYTGIRCGGAWAHTATEESAPPRYRFAETIDSGAGGECKGTGEVTLVPRGEGLSYTFTGGGVTSTGTLARTDATGLAPVFSQAGLPPPG